MKKLRSCPFLILITAILLFFSILFWCKQDTVFSEEENRFLAKMPKLTLTSLLDSNFTAAYEKYVSEQFPWRNAWIRIKALTEAATGKQENNNIIRGKEGYLFARNLKITDQAEKNVEQIRRFGEKAAEAGIVTQFSIIPNSGSVLKEKLPKGAPVFDQKKQIAEYAARFRTGKGADWLDLQAVLEAHKEEEIYYRTDHHWTTLGAYYAYGEFAAANGLRPADPAEYKELRVPGFYGTYDAKFKGIGIKPDTIQYFDIPIKEMRVGEESMAALYDESKREVRDKYAMFLYGNHALTEITTETENGRSLLVLKDSYANSLIPFLTVNYEKLYVVDLRYFNGDVLELAGDRGVTQIWLLYNFDTLAEDNHFYRLKS